MGSELDKWGQSKYTVVLDKWGQSKYTVVLTTIYLIRPFNL